MLSGDCNVCINGKLPSYSATCVECGLLRKNYKPITNYDLLIRKTPEELAEWIETIANCDSCQYSWSFGKCRGGEGTSHAACCLKWLDWLKQEIKE